MFRRVVPACSLSIEALLWFTGKDQRRSSILTWPRPIQEDSHEGMKKTGCFEDKFLFFMTSTLFFARGI
jgi:hypothetical protein